MTYSFSLRWFTASALALVACNGAESLGEYETDGSGDGGSDGSGDDGSGGGSISASSTASASASASASATATDDGDTGTSASASATASATDDGESADTGGGACMGENDCVVYPISCDDTQCGGTSVFDENGCVHTPCTSQPDACASGEFCYRPMDFGGCQSSAVGCFDDESTMSCQCGTLPDCGGAYCLPEDDWPAADPGPGGGANAVTGCAPNDGPAVFLRFGLESDECTSSALDGAPIVSIRLDLAGPGTGTYLFGDFAGGEGSYDPGDGNPVSASYGWVVVESWGATSIAGSYAIVVPDVGFFGADFDMPFCELDQPCG